MPKHLLQGVGLFEVTVVGVRLGPGLLPEKDLSLRLPADASNT